MARQVSELPVHGREKYPWAKWTNGKRWKATKGVDFSCSAVVFRRTVATRASRKGFKVETRVQGETVTFQFSAKV